MLEYNIPVNIADLVEYCSIISGTTMQFVNGNNLGLSAALAAGLFLLGVVWTGSGEFSSGNILAGGSSLGEKAAMQYESSYLRLVIFAIVLASFVWMMYGLGETGSGWIKSIARRAYRKIIPGTRDKEGVKDEPPVAPQDSKLEESLRVIRELKRAALNSEPENKA